MYFSAKRGRRLENTFKLKLISLQKKVGPMTRARRKKIMETKRKLSAWNRFLLPLLSRRYKFNKIMIIIIIYIYVCRSQQQEIPPKPPELRMADSRKKCRKITHTHINAHTITQGKTIICIFMQRPCIQVAKQTKVMLSFEKTPSKS